MCRPGFAERADYMHKFVFGPVMAVIPFDDDADAVRIASDSNYGLGGSVWSTDEERGLNIARPVRTGTMGANYYNLGLGAPFASPSTPAPTRSRSSCH